LFIRITKPIISSYSTIYMNTRSFILILFTVITGMLSCKNKDTPPAVPPTTAFGIINATADTLNYYINGTRQNNLSSIYSSGFTGYVQTITGLQNYSFKKTGSQVVLFSTPYTLDTATYYSMFVAGETADKAFLTADLLDAAADSLSSDSTDSSTMVRFVNAAPSAGTLSFSITKGDTINKGGTVNFNSCAFKYAGSFTRIKLGYKEVKIYQAGITKPAIDTTLILQGNVVYTLFVKGMLNGKGNAAIGVGLIVNDTQ